MIEGLTKYKLRQLLKAEGLSRIDFWEQQGDYRKSIWGLARWGGFGLFSNPTGTHPVNFCSWDTMTECVRRGITIGKEGREWEIHAQACTME